MVDEKSGIVGKMAYSHKPISANLQIISAFYTSEDVGQNIGCRLHDLPEI